MSAGMVIPVEGSGEGDDEEIGILSEGEQRDVGSGCHHPTIQASARRTRGSRQAVWAFRGEVSEPEQQCGIAGIPRDPPVDRLAGDHQQNKKGDGSIGER